MNNAIVLGVPVSTPYYTPGPDYTQGVCGKCACAVWVGPRSRQMLAIGAELLCGLCIAAMSVGQMPKIIDLGNPDTGQIAPGKLEQAVAASVAEWRHSTGRMS